MFTTKYCEKKQNQLFSYLIDDQEKKMIFFAKLKESCSQKVSQWILATGDHRNRISETTSSPYRNKHTVIFRLHRLGAKFYAIAKTFHSIVFNQGLLWQTGAKMSYHREKYLKIYLSVTRISLNIF